MDPFNVLPYNVPFSNSNLMVPDDEMIFSGRKLDAASRKCFLAIVSTQRECTTFEARTIQVVAEGFNKIVDGLETKTNHQAELAKISPDQRADVIEHCVSLFYDVIMGYGNCCRSAELAQEVLNGDIIDLQSLSDERKVALGAVFSYMLGYSVMSPKHRLYSKAVSHFKQAVKLSKRVKGTPYALPGLIQLCWVRSAECFYQRGQPDGFKTCMQKALTQLRHALGPKSVYTLGWLCQQFAAKDAEYVSPEVEMMPAWLEACKNDPTGRMHRLMGWYFCGTAYCKRECMENHISLGMHPCDDCYSSKWCPSGNYYFPLEVESQLLDARVAITEANAQELFNFHVEQASRYFKNDEPGFSDLRQRHARLALRCSEVKSPYNHNAARISNTLMLMRNLSVAQDDQIRGYLRAYGAAQSATGIKAFSARSQLQIERMVVLHDFDEEIVSLAEAAYLLDKNAFAACKNDTEVIAKIRSGM
eukprot:TRINITY_DN5717_c0_g1_i1.p1 TRINITY_DN5717_c0_g1~~TRINITY_DN5717_c0_g1_i1.p1  ORF type:complete len:485 (+),score=99.39 TRINITY_DN5717_c0_g1_i1:33-1457(+)